MTPTNPDSSPEDILAVIRQTAIPAFNRNNVTLMLEPFAALLVRLSRDAEKTAKRNMRVQIITLITTFVVLAVALAQAWIGYTQLSLASAKPQTIQTQPNSTTPQNTPETIPNKQHSETDVPALMPSEEPQKGVPHVPNHQNTSERLRHSWRRGKEVGQSAGQETPVDLQPHILYT